MTKNKAKKAKVTNKKTTKSPAKIISTVAKTDDGTVQINFTVPYKNIEVARKTSIEELGKDIEIPGFRKGNAPEAEMVKHIPQDKVIQGTLSKILPEELGKVIKDERLKPAMYPRYELMKAVDGEPWEIRATTCELPDIKLGEYKKALKGAGKTSAIWTPGKGDAKEELKESSAQEKEQQIIKILLDKVKIEIPALLIEEETNAKLSHLLERIEKLGLNFDSYLKSVGKTPVSIRQEYEGQAKQAISLDLILSQIAIEEGLKVEKSKIDAAIKASAADPEVAKRGDTEGRRKVIESILLKRAALEHCITLL